MESLALLVAILFMIAMFAGPFAIALTAKPLVRALYSKDGISWTILNILRKIIHLFAITLGNLVGLQLIFVAVTPGKLVGLLAVSTCFIALRREYFPEVFILRNLLRKLGLETRWGRSSGNDGHGPEGQH